MSDYRMTLLDWLNVLHLEQYVEVFFRAGLTTPEEWRNLTQEQLEQIGINLPGHQRRILASLNKTLSQCDTSNSVRLDTHLQAPDEKNILKERENREEIIYLEKPVPKQRQVSMDGKPVCPQRETIFKEDDNKEKPVPKQRTKFRAVAPEESAPAEGTVPPVPPRCTPNCPPQRFTFTQTPSSISPTEKQEIPAPMVPRRPQNSPISSINSPSCHTRPQSLTSLQTNQHPASTRDGRRNNSLVSPSPSTTEDKNAPALPPKTGSGPKGPLPVPQLSLKAHSLPSTATAADETHKDGTPQVLPRIKTSQSQENVQQPAQPAPPTRRLPQPPREASSSDDNSDDYEDPDLLYTGAQQLNLPHRDLSLQMASQARQRYSALCSDDELLDDDDSTLWSESSSPQGSLYLPNAERRLSSASRDSDTQESAIIKQGWLDKNPPQGALYYQRRWVILDADYLRYFDNKKGVYSKGIISTPFITNVSSVGELKFEVVTSNRTFIFRAENEAERNEWVAVLQEFTGGRQCRNTVSGSSPLAPDFQGYLGLRGIRSKLYVVAALDKVFLYKNIEDYRIGVGITSIDMNVGNVKVTDQRAFDLTTPYRIFSFIAESEQLKDQWVEVMRNAIGEALSNSEVAKRIWAEPSNSLCADCGASMPEWAAINLCVVICKRCAGEHRGLGPSISKVRSLKMDKKVWTEELIQVFLLLGNERVNRFWAANVPPSEALTPSSCTEVRRLYITNKYRQGKYRKYHQLFGNQKELNNALCLNVDSSDVLETLRLIFCGADVNCSTGMPSCPSPLSLAKAHLQPLQAEFLSHNLNTELPRSEVVQVTDTMPYSAPSSVCLNGFLFKTASMTRAVTDRKAREEFSRRWCTLNDGTFSYYESDKNSSPNGALKASEIVCLSVDTCKHGYNYTFELYTEAERLYLFGTDDAESHKEWVKSIAKSFIPASAEPLLRLGFERIGKLKCKDGLNLQTSKVGWFALEGSTLHAYLDKSHEEEINLRKLTELSTQQEVLVLVEKGRTLYIEGERRLAFAGWCGAIETAAQGGGDTLSEQQLTETDIPVIVHSCISFITQCGLTSEGIYRKSGLNSRVKALLDKFLSDARSICLKEGENQVDDVSNTLKRFFRDLDDGLFTKEQSQNWLTTASIQDKNTRISRYQQFLGKLPCINKATLEALVNHLYCVQCYENVNQMNIHNLAIVFGPTLFQTDGKDYNAGQVIEDLIEHYTSIFEVNPTQLDKQLQEIEVINRLRETFTNKFPSSAPGGNIICTVYLEERSLSEHHVKIPGAMTAAELTWEVLDQRKIPVKDQEYWSCWEIRDKEEIERPLHHMERVLPILHSFGTDSRLIIKKHLAMEAMMTYLANKVDASKHGKMKFRDGRNIPGLGRFSTGFNEKYFTLTSNSLRMYKEVTSNRPEHEWSVKNIKVYLGIKKKLRAPTCWGFTLVSENKKQDKLEKQQWYLCCETQSDLREWFATFLSIQYDGDIWPQDGLKRTSVSRVLPDMHHGNVSLIPLRGSENEMRNSVAAFSQDPLAIFRDVR